MNRDSTIYLAGHTGLVGSALHRNLIKKGYTNIVTRELEQLDLTNQQATADFFKKEKPEYVILAAAKVGGIMANNTYRAQFIYENLQIQNNIIHQSYLNGVKKLLFLGSSCIYPKNAPQPLKEEYLLTGELEYTNEPYAIAKIAGIKMCESYNIQYGTNFISVMPTNLYGPGDNYDLEKSHVLPALIRKMHLGKCLENNDWESIRKDLNSRPIEGINGNSSDQEIMDVLGKYGVKYTSSPPPLSTEAFLTDVASAKSVAKVEPVALTLWGSGKPRREFLHVDDMADACVFIMEGVDFDDLVKINEVSGEIRNTHINIGTGIDIQIKELAAMVKQIVGYDGDIVWNTDKPDGTLKKQLDMDKLHKLGWKENIQIEDGISRVYNDYKEAQT